MWNIKFTRAWLKAQVPLKARRSRTSFAALQGRTHHQVREVIIDQSQEMYENITSSYIMRGRCSAPDRSRALGIQRGSSGKTRASGVHQDVCVPSYMWSDLEFNASAESFVQSGDAQGHSRCMRPDTSDSFPGSGFTSGVVSHEVQISALQIKHGSEAGQVEICREALQTVQYSVSCITNMIAA